MDDRPYDYQDVAGIAIVALTALIERTVPPQLSTRSQGSILGDLLREAQEIYQRGEYRDKLQFCLNVDGDPHKWTVTANPDLKRPLGEAPPAPDFFPKFEK